MGVFDRFRAKGDKVYKLKGYTAANKWRQIEEFDGQVAFDEAIDEVDDPTPYKRFKLMEYRGNKYVRTVWKENNPDFVAPARDKREVGAGDMRKMIQKEIEGSLDEIRSLYETRMEAGMKILTKAYESSIEVLTEAMKTSAKVEVEGVKQKIEQAKELMQIAAPATPAGSKSEGEKGGGFLEEVGEAITDGVKDAVKDGIKARAKKRKVHVPEK